MQHLPPRLLRCHTTELNEGVVKAMNVLRHSRHGMLRHDLSSTMNATLAFWYCRREIRYIALSCCCCNIQIAVLLPLVCELCLVK